MANKNNSGKKKSSSNSRAVNSVKREAVKAAKKHPKVAAALIIAFVVLLIAAIITVYVLKPDFFKNLFIFLDNSIVSTDPDGDGGTGGGNAGQDVNAGEITEISSADLSIHFLELGVANVGDCVLIKVGNTEVLIDAGAKSSSAPTQRMLDYVSTYCTDNILEYVIATHAHEDHIAGLVGQQSGSTRTGFLYSYEIGTIIQFSKTNSNTVVYNNYLAAVNYCAERGTAVYSALDCVDTPIYLDQAQTISMNILYQKYYENTASTENNYSVCMLLTQKLSENKSNNYLFTGDLEKSGEESLVENNPDLPHCVLYKGGHHGSSTSSNDVLLNKITPENIAICTCAGTYEYATKPSSSNTPEQAHLNTFPTQEAIERMAKYTKCVYVTTLGVLNEDYSTKEFVPMNGDIVFYYGKGEEETEKSLKLYCSNNYLKLKETEWFKNNRNMPSIWAS